MSSSTLTRLGWILFAVSGVLFLVPAMRAGDRWTATGCIIWLVAVAIFLWLEVTQSQPD